MSFRDLHVADGWTEIGKGMSWAYGEDHRRYILDLTRSGSKPFDRSCQTTQIFDACFQRRCHSPVDIDFLRLGIQGEITIV